MARRDTQKKEKWSQYKASQLRDSWRRRAKKLNIPVELVPSRGEIQSYIDSFNGTYICYITGKRVPKASIEFDHKIPTGRGGSFSLENTGITSKHFNRIKGMLTDTEFRELLKLISTWDDGGEFLLKRLSAANNIFRRYK